MNDGMKYGSGLTIEQRLARLEQQAILKSIGTTEGDLIGFDDNGLPIRIPAAGANGSVITSDISAPGGAKWVGADVIGINLSSVVAAHASPGSYVDLIGSSAIGATWSYRASMPRGNGLDANAAGFLTIPRSGMYEFSGNVAWAATASQVATAARWRIGSYASPGAAAAFPAGLAHRSSVSEIMGTPLPAQPIYCSAGAHVWVDTYWIWGGGPGSYNFTTGGWTWIQARFLGA